MVTFSNHETQHRTVLCSGENGLGQMLPAMRRLHLCCLLVPLRGSIPISSGLSLTLTTLACTLEQSSRRPYGRGATCLLVADPLQTLAQWHRDTVADAANHRVSVSLC